MNALISLSEHQDLIMSPNCYRVYECITAGYLYQIYSTKIDGTIKDSWRDQSEIEKKAYSAEIDNPYEARWIDLSNLCQLLLTILLYYNIKLEYTSYLDHDV